VIRSSLAAAGPRRLLVLAIAALALTACEAGTNAPTQDYHPPTAGTDKTFGDLSLVNVFVLGPPIGQTLAAGDSASVFLALSNTGSPDKLLSVSAPGVARSGTVSGGSVSLAKQQTVLLTGPAPKIILNDLTRQLAGGTSVRLVLDFQNAGTVDVVVPVMPRAQYYSTLLPPPSPSPSASAKASASPKATASPSASASPSVSPSASPSATP
jgi:copper(I)-binding protein